MTMSAKWNNVLIYLGNNLRVNVFYATKQEETIYFNLETDWGGVFGSFYFEEFEIYLMD